MGDAAKRSVGAGVGQLPDMSFFSISKESGGYQILPSGLIIQWGSTLAGLAGSAGGQGNEVTFPIAFPSACLQITTSYDNGGLTIYPGAAGNFTKNSFLLRCAATSGSYVFRWLAVGK